jgi:hypothetical protein
MSKDINEPMANGYTPLCFSIMYSRVDFVKYLLSRNVDIEKENGGMTPLMYSVRHNSQILELLISAGADINHKIGNRSAIILALEFGKTDEADLLAANGATVDIIDGADGPYIFYDTVHNVTTVISINEQNKLSIDTLPKTPKKIVVKAPGNESFEVPLSKLKTEQRAVFKKPEKIFAMSDIEGNYPDFVRSLKNNGIIDENLNWKFGKGHLVLLGDFVDRGKYVTQVLWLIYKLEQQAKKSGGKVHYLLGNHEVMDLMDDYRFVDIRYKILAYKSGIRLDDFYSNQTEFGAWLRTKNTIIKLGDIIFVHAGISDSILNRNLSITRINNIVRQSIASPDAKITRTGSLILYDYGVFWFRGHITEQDNYGKTPLYSVTRVLSYYNADKLVVGHSIVDDISTDYGGRIIRLDVDHYTNTSCGILIEGNVIYKVKETGEKEVLK